MYGFRFLEPIVKIPAIVSEGTDGSRGRQHQIMATIMSSVCHTYHHKTTFYDSLVGILVDSPSTMFSL